MRLRAFSVQADRDTLFDISDCPVQISKSLVALANKRYSELLQANSIVRCDTKLNLAEGDIVYDKATGELLGYVIFAKGFELQTLTGVVKQLPDKKHIYLRGRTKDSVALVTESCMRAPLLFKFNDVEFYLQAIVKAIDEEHIGILQRKIKPALAVNVKQLQWFTGVTDDNGENIFFGDRVRSGIVSYREGVPVLLAGKKCENLSRGEREV